MAHAFDHLIFDLDGTLIDSRADLTSAVNYARGTFALAPLPEEIVATYVGEGARKLVERALGPTHRDVFEEVLARFMNYYGQHLLDRTRAYDGIPDMLDALAAQGIVLSVLTNKPEAMSRTILDGLGLLPRFIALIGGDSLPARKPDPAGVQHLCSIADTPVNRVLLVGDSPIDLQTAQSAGVAFCGVTWGPTTDRLRAARPPLLIDSPNDLRTVIEAS